MSHIVTIATKVHDFAAVRAACQRLNLSPPSQGAAKLFSGEATGLLVQLPDWNYPLVIDTQTGQISFDNFGGAWGSQVQLDRFLQCYAAEMVKQEARKKGYNVSEHTLQDGSICIQLSERV
jgi:hypothetical protein